MFAFIIALIICLIAVALGFVVSAFITHTDTKRAAAVVPERR